MNILLTRMMAGTLWNQRPGSNGMGGRDRLEYAFYGHFLKEN